jgi:hypothetical protein
MKYRGTSLEIEHMYVLCEQVTQVSSDNMIVRGGGITPCLGDVNTIRIRVRDKELRAHTV